MDLENLRYKYFFTEIHLLGQKSAGVRGFNNIQDYYSIRNECLQSGKLFEDPEFPPTDKWIRPKEICKNLGLDSPKFFVEGVSRFDIKQGRLGDCWFLAAMTGITQNKDIFNRIVCKDNSFDENYAGIFHFRFWIHGKWVEVVVDDRLPVNAYGQLNCLRSNEPNEFWSALLEKAYAKIFGGYEALDGGLAGDAFEDFTGGYSERFNLESPPKNLFMIIQEAAKEGYMTCSLKPDPNQKEAICSNGLIQGHAYSVTGAKTIGVDVVGTIINVDLIRLRNPWGKGEWNGAWSDGKIEWNLLTEEQRNELELTAEQDGEFWMSYEDFISLFEILELCRPTAQAIDEKQRKDYYWETETFHGAWIKGESAGGCRNYIDTFHTNPQFVFTLQTDDVTYNDGRCKILVSLMQKYGRNTTSGPDYFHIGFSIYQIPENIVSLVPMKDIFFRYKQPIERVSFSNVRGNNARFNLEPGHYLIVPSTYYQNQETEFLLRICYEKKFDRSKLKIVVFKEANEHVKDSEKFITGDNFAPCTAENFDSCNMTPGDPTSKEPSEDQKIEKIFKDAAGSNSEIDWTILKTILDDSIPEENRTKGSYSDYKNDGFSRDICRAIIAMFDTDYSRRLNLDEFKKFYTTYNKWKDVFQKFNIWDAWKLSPADLINAFKSAGLEISVQVANLLVYRYGTPYNTILFEDFIMCAVKASSMIERFDEKVGENKEAATFNKDDWIATTLYS